MIGGNARNHMRIPTAYIRAGFELRKIRDVDNRRVAVGSSGFVNRSKVRSKNDKRGTARDIFAC